MAGIIKMCLVVLIGKMAIFIVWECKQTLGFNAQVLLSP